MIDGLVIVAKVSCICPWHRVALSSLLVMKNVWFRRPIAMSTFKPQNEKLITIVYILFRNGRIWEMSSWAMKVDVVD